MHRMRDVALFCAWTLVFTAAASAAQPTTPELTRVVDSSAIQGSLLLGAPSLSNGYITFAMWSPAGTRIYLYGNGTLKLIVDLTTIVPGTTEPFAPNDNFGAPMVDAHGNVAVLVNGGVHNGVYLYRNSTATIEAIATLATTIPGSSAQFRVFSDLLAHLDDGHIVFTGGAATTDGVFTNVNGPLEAVSQWPIPPAGSPFLNGFGRQPSIQGNQVVFSACFGAANCTSGSLFGLFLWDATSKLVTTLWQNTSAGIVAPEQGATLDHGVVAFRGNNTGQLAIYAIEAGALRTVADTLTPVPGGVGTFAGFLLNQAEDLGVSIDKGRIAFGGSSFGPALTQGLYIDDHGVLSKAIAVGDSVSGQILTSIGNGFGQLAFSDKSFSDDMLVFFGSTTDDDGTHLHNHSGVYLLNLKPDHIAPVVTVPASISVPATEAGGATAAASSLLASFLVGGSAADAIDPSPVRLTAQLNGADVTATTIFPLGTSTVTFRFADASGNVGTATSTVVVAVGLPKLVVAIAGKGVDSSGAYFVDVQFTNTGTGNARNVSIDSLTLKTLTGTGVVTKLSPALPTVASSIDVGFSATIHFVLNRPVTVARFSLTETGTLQNVSGSASSFSAGQSVIP